MTDTIKVVAISCSPSVGGTTRRALEAVLAGSSAAGAECSVVELGPDPDFAAAVEAIREADAVVFGSPMYRGTYTAHFKALTEAIQRTPDDAPLTGRAVTTVATAGGDHHLLGMGGMRDILVDFFAAHVVSPGLYVSPSGFDGDDFSASLRSRAETLGVALTELASAIRGSSGLAHVTANV